MSDGREELSPPTNILLERVLGHRARISVVGQGYVGLTMAAAAADAGFPVVGIDTDPRRIHDLAAGLQSVPGVDSSTYKAGLGAVGCRSRPNRTR
jgi:UDP-N-acetyl-D-glucosamine dehydrogenase